MKVTLELDMNALTDIDKLLRVPDREVFLKAVRGDSSEISTNLAVRILKLRMLLGLSLDFDNEGNSPAINGVPCYQRS